MNKLCPPNRHDDLCLCFSFHPSSMVGAFMNSQELMKIKNPIKIMTCCHALYGCLYFLIPNQFLFLLQMILQEGIREGITSGCRESRKRRPARFPLANSEHWAKKCTWKGCNYMRRVSGFCLHILYVGSRNQTHTVASASARDRLSYFILIIFTYFCSNLGSLQTG